MNIKKIGLTALAGSLVATSAFAGELTLNGNATISYSNYEGNHTDTSASANANNNWGMDQDIIASGSGELENGWTVTLTHGLGINGYHTDTSSIVIDMGDSGKLAFSDEWVGGGLMAIDDITPTAWEEATDGPLGERQAAMPTGGGFAYSNSFAGATVSITYSDNLSGNGDINDGKVSTDGTDDGSSHSIGIQYPVGDTGLMVYGGLGTEGQADGKDIDHNTVGFKYTFGPISIGAQRNDEDDSAVLSPLDLETTILGISYMINENLSVSYGQHTTQTSGAMDQEIDSIQAAYSMGGIAVKVQSSQGDNIANSTGKTSEKTEVAISFAF